MTRSVPTRAGRRVRSRALVAAAMVLAVGVAGCTSGSEDSKEPADDRATTTTTETSVAAAEGEGAASTDPVEPGTDAAGTSTDPRIDVLPIPVVGDAVAPVGMDATAEFGGGVSARVLGTTPVEIEGKLPGETSGAGVEVVVEITNAGTAPVDLTNVTVDLMDNDGASFVRVDSDERHQEFGGVVQPGDSSTATHLFRIESDERDDVFLTLKYSADTPTVIFAGRVAE